MLKMFLNQVTIDKFRVFGTNKEEWQAALLEEIDADQLPEFYGGTLTNLDEGDPNNFFKVNHLKYFKTFFFLHKELTMFEYLV